MSGLKTDDGTHNKESCDAAMIGQLRTQLVKANERVRELERFQEEIAYRCFLAGLTTEKPREPNVQNNTATAISHFNVMVDHHARSASRHILEQLRKEQDE